MSKQGESLFETRDDVIKLITVLRMCNSGAKLSLRSSKLVAAAAGVYAVEKICSWVGPSSVTDYFNY